LLNDARVRDGDTGTFLSHTHIDDAGGRFAAVNAAKIVGLPHIRPHQRRTKLNYLQKNRSVIALTITSASRRSWPNSTILSSRRSCRLIAGCSPSAICRQNSTTSIWLAAFRNSTRRHQATPKEPLPKPCEQPKKHRRASDRRCPSRQSRSFCCSTDHG